MPGIISVEEAVRRLQDNLNPLDRVLVDLENSLGMVLSDNIQSPIDMPLFDNSQMDGYAVKSEDVKGASTHHPIKLKIIADIPAGKFPDFMLHNSEAARIMTGAPIPGGADLVIPVEDTDQDIELHDLQSKGFVKILRAGSPRNFIRPHGQDIRQGQIVLSAGKRIQPQDVGLLAMLGVPLVPVYRMPRVALLSSGNELIPVDEPLLPGKIHDANSVMINALLKRFKVDVIRLGIALDNTDSISICLDRAVSEKADLIISSAGVSVGAFDYMREVLEKNGKIQFWRVNIRPGKPIAFGDYKGIPLIGLPGNPVSAFVGFEVFVTPAICKLSGIEVCPRKQILARLTQSVESDGCESYLRCQVDHQNGEWTARLTETHQGSGNLFSLVQANALLIVPSGVKSLPADSLINIWLLDEL